MAKAKEISRRQFVASALTTATLASLPIDHLFAGAMPNQSASAAAPTPVPSWKDQGIENLTKSPHAKLRNVPVHAVTIKSGFWAQRRKINVDKSIPSMHDLLEANG